ncbi:TetR/AcrR family transcriptional regulator [Leeia sp.]|uniref:TetR/AcrR family transcriptional regulator n=1 Tax=Leeia sp. TaxID=2884678 RepID=UPI0035B07982
MVIASGNRSREAEMQAGRAATQDRIVETADRLFYERGYDHTSFADIADEVGLSRGNFYYHFKTKDDILTAVIAHRSRKTQQMLAAWADHAADPAGRIRQFIGMMTMNAARIRRHGCPVGTLCTELAKLEHPALPQASQLFTLFRQWLAQQFAQLGYASEADALAMHLLGRSQGIATLASAFNDEAYIQQEVAQLNQWLAQLPPPSGK